MARSRRLSINVTEEERDLIENTAKKENKSINSFMVELAVKRAVQLLKK